MRAIVEAAVLLTGQGQRTALEARVLGRAPEQTLSQLRAALRRAVLALDPDGAAARHQEARSRRRVVVGPDAEGMASLWALLSAPDATAAYQRLCQLARSLGAEDPRGMDARRADLLVELLTGRRCAATGTPTGTPTGDVEEDCPGDDCDCDGRDPDDGNACSGTGDAGAGDAGAGGAAPGVRASGGGQHRCGAGSGVVQPLVSVIVPITMLMGLDEQPGELVGHGPIPAALAREIAAEGTWRRLLTDPLSGTLLDHGRKTYTPPAGLADFVRVRDVHCRFPTCGQLAARADLDHVVAYEAGGSTSADNLHACCRHRHRTKTHAPGWHLEQHPDGRVTWTTPTGHRHTSHPHDYRPDPSAPSEAGAGGVHDPPDPDPPPF